MADVPAVVWRPPGPLVAMLVAALLGLPACDAGGASSDGITVAAASDLRPAFEELGTTFTDETGIEVTYSFGSSGQLREQVLNGAPFDLFASADEAYVDEVVASGRGVAATKARYAVGRIALWSPPDTTVPARVEALVDPSYRRIAIANPDHAPYGVAARDALVSAGVHAAVEDRLVYGENISDTMRIVRSGNADVGIVARSLAIDGGGDHSLVPEDLHAPLHQALVVTDGDREADARRFAELVTSPAGQAVLARHGFGRPGGEVAAG